MIQDFHPGFRFFPSRIPDPDPQHCFLLFYFTRKIFFIHTVSSHAEEPCRLADTFLRLFSGKNDLNLTEFPQP
jgi:hypothetical protein